MTNIARLLEIFRPVFRFMETSESAPVAGYAQSRRQKPADVAGRMHAFEIERIRKSPASLISPRF